MGTKSSWYYAYECERSTKMKTTDINIIKNAGMRKYAQSFLVRHNKTFTSDFDRYQHIVQNGVGVLVEAGFIDWTDLPECWAGPWDSKYVFYKIVNHSLQDLPSREELELSFKKSARTAAWIYPKRLKDNYYTDIKDRYVKRMTYQEYIKLCNDMTAAEAEEFEKNVEQYISRRYKEINQILTFETPVRIYMCGTDDTSYSLCVQTPEDAISIIDDLSNNSTWENLRNMGFVFTN
jgi:hypothetical protein